MSVGLPILPDIASESSPNDEGYWFAMDPVKSAFLTSGSFVFGEDSGQRLHIHELMMALGQEALHAHDQANG